MFKIFGLLHLIINLSAGKTECFLSYRSTGSTAHREARRAQDGKLYVKIPEFPLNKIHVVGHYKHLGTICSPKGD